VLEQPEVGATPLLLTGAEATSRSIALRLAAGGELAGLKRDGATPLLRSTPGSMRLAGAEAEAASRSIALRVAAGGELAGLKRDGATVAVGRLFTPSRLSSRAGDEPDARLGRAAEEAARKDSASFGRPAGDKAADVELGRAAEEAARKDAASFGRPAAADVEIGRADDEAARKDAASFGRPTGDTDVELGRADDDAARNAAALLGRAGALSRNAAAKLGRAEEPASKDAASAGRTADEPARKEAASAAAAALGRAGASGAAGARASRPMEATQSSPRKLSRTRARRGGASVVTLSGRTGPSPARLSASRWRPRESGEMHTPTSEEAATPAGAPPKEARKSLAEPRELGSAPRAGDAGGSSPRALRTRSAASIADASSRCSASNSVATLELWSRSHDGTEPTRFSCCVSCARSRAISAWSSSRSASHASSR